MCEVFACVFMAGWVSTVARLVRSSTRFVRRIRAQQNLRRQNAMSIFLKYRISIAKTRATYVEIYIGSSQSI
jgi:hypothetical protein